MFWMPLKANGQCKSNWVGQAQKKLLKCISQNIKSIGFCLSIKGKLQIQITLKFESRRSYITPCYVELNQLQVIISSYYFRLIRKGKTMPNTFSDCLFSDLFVCLFDCLFGCLLLSEIFVYYILLRIQNARHLHV